MVRRRLPAFLSGSLLYPHSALGRGECLGDGYLFKCPEPGCGKEKRVPRLPKLPIYCKNGHRARKMRVKG